MQIQTILRSINKSKPKLLTVYNNHNFLHMLKDFDVYCLVVPQISDLRHKIEFPNILPIGDYSSFEYDLCFSFSGGISSKILKEAAEKRRTDLINYELDYPIDIISDIPYISNNKNSLFPTESFKEKVNGKGDICFLNIGNFNNLNPINNRKINVCTIGDFLIESELSSHFSDWNYIVNTLSNCQIFGLNPRLGTYNPNPKELVNIFNNTKIYINTKTHGYFPIEMIQAMACGCAVISYDYPGIRDILPKIFIVNNKNECREKLSELISKPHIIEKIGEMNRSIVNNIKFNNLTEYINKKWEDICEHNTQFYRI